jgi:hypothetical protein
MVWDSEKACEVKSQDYTRKFLMLLCRSRVDVWLDLKLGRGGIILGRD